MAQQTCCDWFSLEDMSTGLTLKHMPRWQCVNVSCWVTFHLKCNCLLLRRHLTDPINGHWIVMIYSIPLFSIHLASCPVTVRIGNPPTSYFPSSCYTVNPESFRAVKMTWKLYVHLTQTLILARLTNFHVKSTSFFDFWAHFTNIYMLIQPN